jgi:hypothetical protein
MTALLVAAAMAVLSLHMQITAMAVVGRTLRDPSSRPRAEITLSAPHQRFTRADFVLAA